MYKMMCHDERYRPVGSPLPLRYPPPILVVGEPALEFAKHAFRNEKMEESATTRAPCYVAEKKLSHLEVERRQAERIRAAATAGRIFVRLRFCSHGRNSVCSIQT